MFYGEMSSETELRTGASDGGEHTNLTLLSMMICYDMNV